jgi:protein-disulfide isomerase
MRHSRGSFSIASCVAVLLMTAAAASAQPVATIGSATISPQELERAVGTRLTRIRTEEYNTRRAVLDELIATKLIEGEAARRHITTEELFKIEIEDRIAQPLAAEIEPVYEGVADRFPNMTREQAIEQMADGMRRQRIGARRTEFVKQLRAAAGVTIHLDPPRVTVKADGPSRGGSAAAPVTIVEFSDFECPFCSRANETLRQIEKTYGEKVRIVFRDYPLASHRSAKRAAEAARCADDQGKFWEMHDRLFSKGGGPLQEADINRYATQASLDLVKFDACLTSGKYKEAWRASQEEGYRAGVTSTPSFFINGRMVIGAATFDTFAKVIDEEIAASRPAPTAVASATR